MIEASSPKILLGKDPKQEICQTVHHQPTIADMYLMYKEQQQGEMLNEKVEYVFQEKKSLK
jgi:hypothetical protein